MVQCCVQCQLQYNKITRVYTYDMSHEELRQRLEHLCHHLGSDEAITVTWWARIVSKYTEDQRFYHTLDHLDEMFTHFDRWKDNISNLTAVSLAIFFHDIVYNPKSSTNEEDSVKMFREVAADLKIDNTDKELCDTTINFIDATKSHIACLRENKDMMFFLDFDMAVLGRQSQGYDEYAEQIRKEYIHIPENIYCEKRSEVLQDFLKRDMFSTKEFCDLYEETARENITREITNLKNKSQGMQR